MSFFPFPRSRNFLHFALVSEITSSSSPWLLMMTLGRKNNVGKYFLSGENMKEKENSIKNAEFPKYIKAPYFVFLVHSARIRWVFIFPRNSDICVWATHVGGRRFDSRQSPSLFTSVITTQPQRLLIPWFPCFECLFEYLTREFFDYNGISQAVSFLGPLSVGFISWY